ncbi:MAG: hypothetical protein P1V51_08675 [Deltaproteobacteria bacterium]|nr:hypothetical protein [Deltaproteobacteria bacterium]
MGMGSGGMVIIEMQRQMKAARGGQDLWGGLVFALGLYGLFGTILPVLGSLILVVAIAIRVRQDHIVFGMIDALDPSVRTSFPWRLWALLLSAAVVAIQLGTIALLEPWLVAYVDTGAASAALMLALVPVGLFVFAVEAYFDPVRLGLITEWVLRRRQR